ncbi:MAG: acyl-ACP thioesterase domain-containing protein [Bacteroidales bacterium]
MKQDTTSETYRSDISKSQIINSLTLREKVKAFQADSQKYYKPYNFMCATQDIANDHAELIGFGYDALFKQNAAWVLSRFKVEIDHTPRLYDEIDLSTWHKGPQGPFWIRDFQVNNPKTGESMIRCTSSWVIIDLKERKMKHLESVLPLDAEASKNDKDAISIACKKIRAPKNIKINLSGKHKVVYSDLDMNRHANNAKYIEWILDYIDTEITSYYTISSFQINFNHETYLSDIVEIYTAEIDPSHSDNEHTNSNENTDKENTKHYRKFYAQGLCEGKNIFQAELTFAK